MEPLREYLKAERGRTNQLAQFIGISPEAISQWERVPANRVAKVESFTGISRHALRPDIFGPAPTEETTQAERAA